MMQKVVLQFLLSIGRRSMNMDFLVMWAAIMSGKAEIHTLNLLD